MELRHLRYFVVVAEEENFSRAARRLHVSQSPLSRQIAQLAEELGVELFAPSGRGVKLTFAGKTFLDGARATIARADRAIADTREAARGRVGTLAIGFEGGSAYSGLLPEVVAAFRKRHPQVQLRLLPLGSVEQLAALRAGTIAIGYGYGSPANAPDVRSRLLFRDRLGVVVPKRHRLAKKRTLQMIDLEGEPFVWQPREENPAFHDEVIVAFRSHGLILAIAQEETDGEAVLTLVASGAGLTFSVESAASLLRGGAVVLRRVSDLGVVMQGRSMWLVRDEREPLVRSFLEITNALHASS